MKILCCRCMLELFFLKAKVEDLNLAIFDNLYIYINRKRYMFKKIYKLNIPSKKNCLK